MEEIEAEKLKTDDDENSDSTFIEKIVAQNDEQFIKHMSFACLPQFSIDSSLDSNDLVNEWKIFSEKNSYSLHEILDIIISEILCSNISHVKLYEILLITLPLFSNPMNIFLLLETKFNSADVNSEQIIQNLKTFLEYWMDKYWIQDFLNNTQLNDYIQQFCNKHKIQLNINNCQTNNENIQWKENEIKEEEDWMSNINENEFAEQLTILDWQLFSNIKKRDLLIFKYFLFLSPFYQQRIPTQNNDEMLELNNVFLILKRFKNLSKLVRNTLLFKTESEKKNQNEKYSQLYLKIFKRAIKWVKITEVLLNIFIIYLHYLYIQRLRELRNFNSAKAIFDAISECLESAWFLDYYVRCKISNDSISDEHAIDEKYKNECDICSQDWDKCLPVWQSLQKLFECHSKRIKPKEIMNENMANTNYYLTGFEHLNNQTFKYFPQTIAFVHLFLMQLNSIEFAEINGDQDGSESKFGVIDLQISILEMHELFGILDALNAFQLKFNYKQQLVIGYFKCIVSSNDVLGMKLQNFDSNIVEICAKYVRLMPYETISNNPRVYKMLQQLLH